MKISFVNESVLDYRCDILVLGAFEGKLCDAPSFLDLDRALGGLLARLVDEERMACKEGQSLLVHTHGRIGPERLLLVGLGKREDFSIPDFRKYGALFAKTSIARGCHSVASAPLPVDAGAQDRALQFMAEGFELGRYRFDRYVGEEAREKDLIERCVVLVPDPTSKVSPICFARAEAVAGAVNYARDLVNEPASTLTPIRLAEAAAALAKDKDLECTILGVRECEKLKMNLFLAVARGSVNEPRFIHLTFRPRGKDEPRRRIALVGKGVTFDSGGLSLKPNDSMIDMKCDMAGAAAVLGVASALAALGAKAEVHILVAATENMLSGSAYKLGDVIIGMGEKSVEITNTDAEGRLTLADALAYARTFEPDEIIDVATLTGACVVALGPHMAGLMGSDLAFVERFAAAARAAGEDVWPLPLQRRLKEQLKSPIADMKNVGERWGGALTAGLFLKEFAGDVPWIHLDIAGPAYASKAADHQPQGGTGFGVSAILEYLRSRE
jgi:leucyl aminopeptidase